MLTSRARNRVKTCNKCEQYRSKLVCSVTTRKQLSVQARSETLKLGDEVTFGGILFHNCAATSLRPEKHDRRRNRGMMSSAVDAERSESVQARRHVALLWMGDWVLGVENHISSPIPTLQILERVSPHSPCPVSPAVNVPATINFKIWRKNIKYCDENFELFSWTDPDLQQKGLYHLVSLSLTHY